MRCPGQDTRYWKEDAIFEVKCPHCGQEVEFFKDEASRRCSNCGKRLPNPRMDFGCAAYCPYAEQCLGSISPELLKQRQEFLKDRLEKKVESLLRERPEATERINLRRQYAERLVPEEGGRLAIVLMASYLAEFPDYFQKILEDIRASEDMIAEVKKILSTKVPSSLEAQIFHDIQLLVHWDLEGEKPDLGAFLTEAGRNQARAKKLTG
ncbi:phosphohydrolase [Thermosulfuriphilus sp.]